MEGLQAPPLLQALPDDLHASSRASAPVTSFGDRPLIEQPGGHVGQLRSVEVGLAVIVSEMSVPLLEELNPARPPTLSDWLR